MFLKYHEVLCEILALAQYRKTPYLVPGTTLVLMVLQNPKCTNFSPLVPVLSPKEIFFVPVQRHYF
jgi:hypothetical protein